MSLPRMVVLGWASEGTGFTRVLHEVLRPLTSHFEIHQVGIGYHGPRLDGDWSLYPCDSDGSDMYGVFAAEALIASVDPEVVFILHDIWMFEYYFRILKPEHQRFRTVVYFPLDGRIKEASLAAPLLKADLVVTYTQRASDDVAHAMTAVATEGERVPEVHVIAHGVDMSQFYPLSANHAEQQSLKREAFPKIEDPEQAFIILNASRPDVRKRLDITLEGFALFAEGKPANVMLCLHHAKSSAQVQEKLRALATDLGILERILWNPLSCGDAPLSDAELNRLYNACDVGLNTSSGEGWGLVSCEHAAAGKPQVVPDHSACSEIWKGAAELVAPTIYEVPHYSPLEMAAVSPAGVADALERLYSDRDYREMMGGSGRERVAKTEWTWPAIAEQWKQLLVG
ncbi:glycosyltransferase family protein [Rubritalea sp.]|uniref:glycosyltransferase family protein n=1 Tax=Rubritalea sp. TaxID=2109375 RepID=UPI003EF1DF21